VIHKPVANTFCKLSARTNFGRSVLKWNTVCTLVLQLRKLSLMNKYKWWMNKITDDVLTIKYVRYLFLKFWTLPSQSHEIWRGIFLNFKVVHMISKTLHRNALKCFLTASSRTECILSCIFHVTAIYSVTAPCTVCKLGFSRNNWRDAVESSCRTLATSMIRYRNSEHSTLLQHDCPVLTCVQ
jgi:hypothetical protein